MTLLASSSGLKEDIQIIVKHDSLGVRRFGQKLWLMNCRIFGILTRIPATKVRGIGSQYNPEEVLRKTCCKLSEQSFLARQDYPALSITAVQS